MKWLQFPRVRLVFLKLGLQYRLCSVVMEVIGPHPSVGVLKQPLVFTVVVAESALMCAVVIPCVILWEADVFCIFEEEVGWWRDVRFSRL